MNAAPVISVVVPVRNEGVRLIHMVDSVVGGRTHASPLEIVLSDDDSHDGACDIVATRYAADPSVHVIVRRLGRHAGVPYARNRAAEAASAPILVVTDANTVFPSGWDAPVRHAFAPGRLLCATIRDLNSAHVGYGCQLTLPSLAVSWIPTPTAYGGYVPIAPCTATVIGRFAFHQLGGYDETLPLYGAAEPEFSVRAWLSGYDIVNLPDLEVRHWFRPKHEYDSFRRAISDTLIENNLRFATYYLPDDLLMQAYDYYARVYPVPTASWIERTRHPDADVWVRRSQLRQLPYDGAWFIERFALTLSAVGA